MTQMTVSLNDKYDLSVSPTLLNGTQALVRLMLMQKERDRRAGHNTAGYVTGYRGSPLGAVDTQMSRAETLLKAADITVQPGLNEDLAATALWGSQQAELRGEGKYDGVFGLWYGKGPGVDRSGDVMRHANMAGTSPLGGVIMAMGDDHTGESSTSLHQSDWGMIDAGMPIVSPAGVQEILDYGIYAWAMSRYAGVWVGLKTMKDTVEVTSVVNSDALNREFVAPDHPLPKDGVHIRLIDTPVAQEARLIDHKISAARAFARANRMDARVWGTSGARIGFVSAGKSWLDLQHALSLLGLDEATATEMGITTYKVGQIWPLDLISFQDWADGLDLIVVVEEKRKVLEGQIKEHLFDHPDTRVYGHKKGDEELFTTRYALDPVAVAQQIGTVLGDEGCGSPELSAKLGALNEAQRAGNQPELASRLPYFCAGCPHNSSTVLPDQSRAYAGIGCHYLVQWMDRETLGFTHMGGEGANWVGEAPFSKTEHVFQNIGDGTYNHSGIQAIRYAVMAGTTMTYKILYNDAVAMTGGQTNDGGLSAAQICQEVLAMGVKHVAAVYDPKEALDLAAFPKGVTLHTRDALGDVQEGFRAIKGVSVIVYIQTCAAEKRRRRKRGQLQDPDTRVFIHPEVCEGCGDCGVQSNCVAIVPYETPLGRKRAIDQSACNKDLSCVKGFCPSFITVNGGTPRKAALTEFTLPDLPDPKRPEIVGTHNVVITGVGGTGAITIGAVLAMAARLDGKAASMMEMAGLAQKGGAVHIHCRLANRPEDIFAIRVAVGECDTLIGGDLVVSAGSKTIGLMKTGRTKAVVNDYEMMTGDFTRKPDFQLPGHEMHVALEARLQDALTRFDASALAKRLLGDSIFANMIVFGASFQKGAVPISHQAIIQAITLNGTAAAENIRAFEIGRWAYLHPDEVTQICADQQNPAQETLADKIERRAAHLTAYQDENLAARYRAFIAGIQDPELQEAVAEGYYKLLSYKDEYEVARLLQESHDKASEALDGDLRLSYHLAPPLLSRAGPDGRPRKITFGPWIARLFPLLAAMKRLRGTLFDPFGYTAERKMERALIVAYEDDIRSLPETMDAEQREAALALARLPLDIKGFGPVKAENASKAAKRRAELLAMLDAPRSQIAAQ